MEPWVWLVIAAAVILVIVAAVIAASSRRKSQMQDRFGPEYDRTVEREGGNRSAVKELKEREKRRDQLQIRPLNPISLERYQKGWSDAQERFVDHPQVALKEADELVIAVMRERGYPMDDFEQRAADVSVDHPQVVENYRSAHAISERSEQGQASTEDMRQGMVHYRMLFEELLETDGSNGLNGQSDRRADRLAAEERARR